MHRVQPVRAGRPTCFQSGPGDRVVAEQIEDVFPCEEEERQGDEGERRGGRERREEEIA